MGGGMDNLQAKDDGEHLACNQDNNQGWNKSVHGFHNFYLSQASINLEMYTTYAAMQVSFHFFFQIP